MDMTEKKPKFVKLDEETGLLINEVRSIMLSNDPTIKATDYKVINDALEFYKNNKGVTNVGRRNTKK